MRPQESEVHMGRKLNRIGIVSDLHCGSRWGLRPNPHMGDYKVIEANIWLWECWKRMIRLWGDLDLLILNGDMIDGIQKRSDSTGLVTPNMSEQTALAIECLRPLVAKSKKVIRMTGTPHHETFHGPLSTLDATFGITRPDAPRDMVRDIYLDGGPEDEENSIILNVKHNPEGQKTLYLGTVLDRETRWSVLAESAHAIPRAHFIVQSHIHFASFFGDIVQKKIIITTPCFCMQQPYAVEKRYYGWKPTIGGLLLERDDLSTMGWRYVVKDFPLPPLLAETIDDL